MFQKPNVIHLEIVDKNHSGLAERMKVHYSQPKGFVGRSICYDIRYNADSYGFIVASSATLHLPCERPENLNQIVNNSFYSVSKVNGKYPLRNFTTQVLIEWMRRVIVDWKTVYGDDVLQFETLVEPPRTGELYLRAGFEVKGMTKGFTCKRIGKSVAGESTDGYKGSRRVWNYENLRPKIVLTKKAN